MAFFTAPITCVLLFNGLISVTIGNELPTRCYGSTRMTCYPVIPSFVQFYGWDLPNVEQLSLDKRYNLKWSLQTLPSGLFNWARNIEYLYMNDVGLENIECDTFQPLRNSILSIEMHNNLFREFPSCAMKNLNMLRNIYFSSQNLESVHIDAIELDSLSMIDLGHNKISYFSIYNINNNNDIHIILNYNNISYLNISGVNRISYLQAVQNQLTEINHGIFHYSHSTLVYLHLGLNALDDDVWNVLEDVTSLKKLLLRHNRLQTVSPSVINRLSELTYLDLANNHIASLTDVLLRSGKITDVYFSSNKLVNFPLNLIHDTNTFRDNSVCTLDISNNRMDNIQLNIPTKSTRLRLNLGQNELTSFHFNSNDKEIESLNISSNRLVTLPETLPKAKRYFISNNPLITANVFNHLTTTMNNAVQIEMDDLNFLCNTSEHYDFTKLRFPKIVIFSLRRNCIPPMFLCHIGNNKTNLYLENNNYNSGEDIPCEIHTKEFDVVSFSGSRMNKIFVDLFMAKYTNTISNVSSLYFKRSQLKELPFIRYASLNNYGIHVFDFSENFLEAFNGMEFLTVFNSFTLNLGNNRITKYEKVTLKTTEARNLREYFIYLKYKHNSISRVNTSIILIEIVDKLSYIFISIDLSFNRLHSFDLTSVITSHNDNSYLIVRNLNVSHNDLEVYRNCLPKTLQFYKFDLRYNKLRELPDISCHYATETYLGHNNITEISRTLPTASINKLDLEWNFIHYINSKAFTNMTSLRTLNLRGNKLKNFPKAVQRIRYLTALDISYNEITNIKQSDIDEMNSLTSLILTGNDLTPHSSTSIGLLRPVPGQGLKDNIIYCNCDVLFLRNNTLNTQGRCSFPSEFEGYLVSCFPVNNCVGNVPIYIYKETKISCLNDDYFDIKISMSEVDENRLIRWKRIGPKKQKSLRMIAYRKQNLVKDILVNETGQTYYFVFPSSLNADRVCIHAFLEERSYKRCLDVNSTYIISTNKSGSVSEANSNNGVVYGTSVALVFSVLMNIFGSIFIFAFIKRRKTRSTNEANSNRFDNNAYVPNEYEMSSCRRGACDQQLEVYDELSENCYNNGKETYENLNIGNVRT